MIDSNVPKDDYIEMKKIAGDKINTVIRENTETRYNDIIDDYKEYLNNNIEI